MAVLRYLAERPGQLVSKEELLAGVWSGRVVAKDGLRVCVREIRAALGDPPDAPRYLETVTGRGYRFLERGDDRIRARETTAPVVGRALELRQLEDELRWASDGERRLVFIAGEPGIGKTTLLERFLDAVTDEYPVRVVRGQCVDQYGTREDYGPLLEALTHLCQGPDGTEIVALIRRYAPMSLLQLPGVMEATETERFQRQVGGTAPNRMTRELCNAMERLASDQTLLLVLEDLHWADAATVDFLSALAQRREPARLLLLGTYRPADAVLHAQYLRDLVRDLRVRQRCGELLLELLSVQDVASYLQGRLGGEVADSLAAGVFRRANGNPLFMVNLVEDLLQRQLLVRDDNRWTVEPQAQTLEQAVPETLRSLISRRLQPLAPAERLTLECASVVGLEFSVGALAPMLEYTTDSIGVMCDSLASRSQFIDAIGVAKGPDDTVSDRYRFQHPLYRDVVYEESSQARRARFQRLIDQAVETGGARLVAHQDEIGQAPRAEAGAETRPLRDAHRKSVAVLPLENLSPNPDDAFFAAGLLEAILTELVKIGGLRVMARSSVLPYSNAKASIAKIAADLNVRTVMEGSVQYADEHVRIMARLIDAESGADFWSETYDREFKDIFAIQTDIATRIASVLRDELTQPEQETLAKKPTESPEAYAAYLKAIAVGALAGGLETTPEQCFTIRRSLDQALTLDPGFVLAYSLKARHYAYSMARPVCRSDELTVPLRYELAQENARRALALDANSGLAHAGIAVAHRFAWRDREARLAFERALELDPYDPRVLRDVAFFDLFRGRYRTALEVAREIVEIEPGLGNFLTGYALMSMGDFDGAFAACRRVLSLHPDFSLAYQLQGLILLIRGDKAEALESLRLFEQLGHKASVYAVAHIGFAYQILGHCDDARRIFAQFEDLARKYVVTDAAWALAYLAIDDLESSLRSLRRVVEQEPLGEDISAAMITFNMLSVPVLERQEFLVLRRELGFAG